MLKDDIRIAYHSHIILYQKFQDFVKKTNV